MEYNLIRSRRRTLAIHITKDGELEVRAPLKLSVKYIEDFILQKHVWIDRQITRVLNNKFAPKVFTEGEEFLYLGESYILEFSETVKLPVELHGKLFVAQKHSHHVQKVLLSWYKKEARQVITDRVEQYSAATGLQVKAIRLSNAKQRWGSCSPKGYVNFSWRLIMAPLEIIDYVVVHELVHLKHHDHSKAFWQKVEQIIPDYKSRRKWLKENSHNLTM